MGGPDHAPTVLVGSGHSCGRCVGIRIAQGGILCHRCRLLVKHHHFHSLQWDGHFNVTSADAEIRNRRPERCCPLGMNLHRIVALETGVLPHLDESRLVGVGCGGRYCVCSLDKVFSPAESPLSPPFHPHFSMSDFVRSVPVGCSRFSRCCHLIFDLASIYEIEAGQAINAVTGTRLWAFAFPFEECFGFMPPASLSGCGCARVRRLPRSPTNDAAIPPTFVP
jgi:hypothetical protein